MVVFFFLEKRPFNLSKNESIRVDDASVSCTKGGCNRAAQKRLDLPLMVARLGRNTTEAAAYLWLVCAGGKMKDSKCG